MKKKKGKEKVDIAYFDKRSKKRVDNNKATSVVN